MEHKSSSEFAELAARIKALRRTLQLSQTQLAQRLGTRQSVVSRWEQGKHIPHDSFIAKLARLSGLPAARFRYGNEGEDTEMNELMPRAAWGRRITDHLEAGLKMARKSGQRDVAGALAILLERCQREEHAKRLERDRRANL